ncbi:alpha/beta hydrolase [Actinoplanes sp. LDG1-06]|uniref:Alpha/beta hydrolase n=1 Tax=Paractinoplanes ovalisporus TaxID=2810368 RepID=A0ABS2AFN7_9ACTN|nr:alpha/beta hydrolase [Actinoplanes ovalisporus]MBM2618643.1 alpha/beta hydrolase [Actinoplanes ovalisporus]
MDVLLVLGADLVADRDLLTKVAGDAAWDLEVGLRVVDAATADEIAAHDGPVVVVPADAAAPENAVLYDLTVAAEPLGSRHLHGRGVWGLAWAIKHAVYRLRQPAERIAYGDHAEQWADERTPGAATPTDLPTGATDAPSVAPVGVLIHGGFWRSIWAADLMDALAIDLTARGWISWNLEYRRPDRNGWAATTEDIADGVAAARKRHPGAPIVLFGHSAGGQLALRLAADDPDITLAVSLAGVLDLQEGQRRFLGEGAITTALGGAPAEVPEVYAASDPMTRLPLASPALLVQGSGDSLDLIDINRRFAAASGVTLLEQPGDHFDVIAPTSAIWAATMDAVARRV